MDGIELRLSENGQPQRLSTPQKELDQIQKAAKSSVVFVNEFEWNRETELWKSLEKVGMQDEVTVRLLRSNAPMSSWFPVAYYSNGVWSSTNK